MDKQEIFKVLTGLLDDSLDIEPSNVTLDSTLDSLGIDSLDMVELICNAEEALGVELDDVENCKTIGELVNKIAENE